MATRYAIWDKVSDIYTPAGPKLTAEEWITKYGWINAPGVVPIVAAGPINGALIDELGQMKARCVQRGATFDDSLTDQQLLDAIEAFEDQRNEEAKAAAQEAANTPSADERIAAAMEYANLLNS